MKDDGTGKKIWEAVAIAGLAVIVFSAGLYDYRAGLAAAGVAMVLVSMTR